MIKYSDEIKYTAFLNLKGNIKLGTSVQYISTCTNLPRVEKNTKWNVKKRTRYSGTGDNTVII